MTTPTTHPTHWHVETGLIGYGPDAADSDGFHPFYSRDEIAEAIREELRIGADMAYEAAHSLAETARKYRESGDIDAADIADTFAEAWIELERSDTLANMRANLDTDRKSAPLYADPVEGPGRWEETLAHLISEANTQDLSHNSRLYVWQCAESECHDCAESECPTD